MGTITKTLPCKLTNNEILEKSALASALYKERNEKEVELKTLSSSFKEDIKDLTGQITKLQHAIYNKEEHRPVECAWQFNRKEKIKILKRLDTMEVVETFPLNSAELQEGLFEEPVREFVDSMVSSLSGEEESVTLSYKDKSVTLKGKKRKETDEITQ